MRREADRPKMRPLAAAFALVFATLGLACGGPAPTPQPDRRPDVFLILIDTLRADRLGVLGNESGLSPAIDLFAANATVFENAFSPAPNTIPSLLQIMTSQYGVASRIAPSKPSLAKILRSAGYQTAAVVDNPLLEIDREAHGLMGGFEIFHRNAPIGSGPADQQLYKSRTPGDVITAQGRRVLESRDADRSLLLWLHYFDPHDPYSPPFVDDRDGLSWATGRRVTGDIRGTRLFGPGRSDDPAPDESDRAHLRRLYDAEVRYVDRAVGEFLDELKRRGLFEQSLIVLSSDHGESLGEHGIWTHGRSLYDPEIHVPLIVKRPGQVVGERISRPVQSIDIVPSILGWLEIDSPAQLEGRLLDEPHDEPALVIWLKQQVVRSTDWKLLEFGDEPELFRIDRDSGELENVADQYPEVVAELRRKRAERLESLRRSSQEIDEQTSEAIERMRALGYLE